LKHIEIKYHYILDMVQRKEVLVQYLPTDDQVVDVLTKPLTRMNFDYFCEIIGMVENAFLTERECWCFHIPETLSRSYSSVTELS
jgi:hypothetical protein